MLHLRAMNEAEICWLYGHSLSRDFPPSELKSLSSILNMHRRGIYDVLGAYLNGDFVGYALLYCPRDERIALLDYLAIEPQDRSRGIGSMLLCQLRSHYAEITDVLMIECEHPETAPDEQEARKRIQFYLASGAVLTSVRIWLFGVEYNILILPCEQTIPECDWSIKMIKLYRQMLPPKLYENNVRLIMT